MTENAVELKNLSWRYNGKDVVNSVNIGIGKGSFTGIIGPNGAGKTTLLKLILRLLTPEENSVFIMGKDIREFSRKELAKKISYVPQTVNAEFGFSVDQIITMGRNPYSSLFSSDPAKDREVVLRVMRETEVDHISKKNIGSISGGELQRVIIARALAQEPLILALDEPTSHLDINHQIKILSLIRSLSRKTGITVIAVLHDFNHALEYCTSLILMDRGRIKASGKPEDVITPKVMKEVYNINVIINRNPFTGKPYIVNEYL